MYTVGQLSDMTGVSIRTLHYYEKMGLIQPQRQEPSNYRLYGDSDLLRLQQIAVMKRMHFTLREIGDVLQRQTAYESGPVSAWEEALQNQIQAVQVRKEELDQVEQLLSASLYAMRVTGKVDAEEMAGFIRQLDKPQAPPRPHSLQPEERNSIAVNDPNHPLVWEWAEILREVHAHHTESPDSEASQKLALNIMNYGERLFEGNVELADKFWTSIVPEEGEPARRYGMTAEVMTYIERILEQWTADNSKTE